MKYLAYSSFLLLLACGGKKHDSAPTASDTLHANQIVLTEAQLKNAALEMMIPPVRTGVSSVSVKGNIEAPPQNRISVTAPLGGYIKQIRVHIGDRVTKGETLAVLEDMQFIQLQQDYLSGKTRLLQLQTEYERQTTLSKTQASSLKEAELAKANFDNQTILVKALGEKLRLIGMAPENLTVDNIRSALPIKSSINGFVTGINANVGKYVSGAETVMELVDPSDIHLSLHVFEKDLPALHIGQKVQAHTNNDPSKKYDAEIVLIGKTVAPDKSVAVHCHFNSVAPELIPGLYMNAYIQAEGQPAPAVPNDAIIYENGKPFVFEYQTRNTFLMQPVTLQWIQNDSSGIAWTNAGSTPKTVVMKNAYALYMQLRSQGE